MAGFVPREMFFTKGVGKHREKLTSFELALRSAGIAACNLVRVSSIFPPKCKILSRAEGVLETGVSHVSCYALIYEEGTPLDSWRRLGKVIPVADDDVARRWELVDATLSSAGLPRYEISNWGRPSRHNSLYWAGGLSSKAAKLTVVVPNTAGAKLK